MYSYYAQVVQIIDGDSILCYVDLGFYTYTMVVLRLTGIELKTPSDTEEEKREKKAVNFLADKFKADNHIIVETEALEHCIRADIIFDGKTVNDEMEKKRLLRGTIPDLAVIH
jgi:hypothetical protein